MHLHDTSAAMLQPTRTLPSGLHTGPSIDTILSLKASGAAHLRLAAQVVGRGAEGDGDDLQAVHARLPRQVLPSKCVI